MMNRLLLLSLIVFINLPSIAQTPDIYGRDYSINPISTAVPFMNIAANSRLGAFGEIGVVSSGFYKEAALYQNPALLPGNERYVGGSISYAPWLRSLVDDIYLSQLNAYASVDDKNILGFSFKSLHMGEVMYTDNHGQPIGSVNAYDFYIQTTYAHKLNKYWSFGGGIKFLHSKMGIRDHMKLDEGSVNSLAVDLGVRYTNSSEISRNSRINYVLGTAINNFGPKIKYSDDPDARKDFIPTMLSLGILIHPDFYLNPDFRMNLELAYQVEKLLVPTPAIYAYNDSILHIQEGMDRDISPFRALYQSFYDAPGGGEEELQEIIHKLGFECRLNYTDIFYFAMRLGKFMEHENKGNRKFTTYGLGIGIYGFSLDFRKIKPKEDQHPLKDTWGATFGFRTQLDRIFGF